MDQLPEAARKLFDDARAAGNRREQTRIVNNVMRKCKGGKGYYIDETAPIFEELQSKYERRYASQRDRGVIRAVMEGMVGGEAALQRAIADGDITTTVGEDGRTYYISRELETGKEEGVTCNRTLSNKHNISNETAKKVSAMLESLNWSFKVTAAEQKV